MTKETILEVRKQFEEALNRAKDPASLEKVKHEFLGRKGKVAGLFSMMGDIPPESRKEMGKMLNKLKG
ncbi:MAG: hypothetical protein U5N26_04845 [Candidatus Marinimicrobia bacterium]|nr:hypothetical protein [Candidatus Neomarinimicrobiota bacterium]